MNDTSGSPPEMPSAGAALLNERRRQGLSLGDVSRQLKLSVRQVEALERDDYSAYKGPLFIHGFIRNYAKLLGLDPEPLIRSTDSLLNPRQEAAEADPEPQRARPVVAQEQKFRHWPAVVVVVLIGIALAFVFGGRRTQDAGRGAPPIAQNDQPAPEAKTPVESRAAAEKRSAESKPNPPPATKPVAKPETSIASTPASDPVAQVPAAADDGVAVESSSRLTVRMIFDEESWVEIKDREGNTIFGQLGAPGTRRSVSGEPPLSVVVGNAGGVQLFRDNKSVDLAPHTRMAVARLTLE